MAYFFDIEKVAKEAGIDEVLFKKVKDEVRHEFLEDDMMYELHVLRAIESLVHPLPLRKKASAL